jgi:hypothetical protein
MPAFLRGLVVLDWLLEGEETAAISAEHRDKSLEF